MIYRALSLRREYGLPLQLALRQAHLAGQLLTALRGGEVCFGYVKQDGTTRHARGTLTGYRYSFRKPYQPRPDNLFIVYYDLDCRGWRTCRVVSLQYVRPFPEPGTSGGSGKAATVFPLPGQQP
ncbi:MAG: SH3 beta-barrel fold-containing protein [Bacteroides sp.]|nr:SH3 beta-barrel fold-containing protein [Bacteroides sp.]